MEVITGKLPHMIWVYVWKYVCPIVILCILVGSIIKQGIHPLTYHIYHNASLSFLDNGCFVTVSVYCSISSRPMASTHLGLSSVLRSSFL